MRHTGRDIQAMRLIFFSTVVLMLSCTFAMGQEISKWYSETSSNGVIIQNSFPKGGPYTGSARGKNFNYSFLIFYTRVVNETTTSMELTIEFPADSFAIPSSPDVFVKLFLPPDTMTHDKQSKYNYGVTGLESFLEFNRPTLLKRTINPKEELLVYIGTVFYQTKSTEAFQERGGNRAELVLKGPNLIYRMLPQIDSLPCGRIGTLK